MNAKTAAFRPSSATGQRGVVLFVALIVLVVMTLAGLAMLRQVGSGVSIVGNVAFKEATTSVGDVGIEQARQWLLANGNSLNLDIPAAGYFSSWSPSVDPSSYLWDDGVVAPNPPGFEGEIKFVIYRLCQTAGIGALDAGQYCSDGPGNSIGASLSGCTYNCGNFIQLPGPYYRVTARIKGPRNSFSYVQVLMN